MMSDDVVHYFFEMNFTNNSTALQDNRAFLYGDAVRVFFFIQQGKAILTEDCYFFLMASMRKMRMNIPMHYTLDFFENLLVEAASGLAAGCAVVEFLCYRKENQVDVSFYLIVQERDILQPAPAIEMDILKEITVNTHLLSNIHVHCPENIYAGIYAAENDLDDVILLNPSKRIARGSRGNLLLLEGESIRIPKQTEGAYISPLLESFVTFVHKQNLANIQEAELIAFETQKSEEILLFSDEYGIAPVIKIRNKTFGTGRFSDMLSVWRQSLL